MFLSHPRPLQLQLTLIAVIRYSSSSGIAPIQPSFQPKSKLTNRFWKKLNGFTIMQVQECMVFRKAGKQLHQSCLLNDEQNWSKQHSAQNNDGSQVFSFMYPTKRLISQWTSDELRNAAIWNSTAIKRCTEQDKTPSNHIERLFLYYNCSGNATILIGLQPKCQEKNAKLWNTTDLCVWCSWFWGALFVLGFRRWNIGILAFCPAII